MHARHQGWTIQDAWQTADAAARALAAWEHWTVVVGLCGAAWLRRAGRQTRDLAGELEVMRDQREADRRTAAATP